MGGGRGGGEQEETVVVEEGEKEEKEMENLQGRWSTRDSFQEEPLCLGKTLTIALALELTPLALDFSRASRVP